MKRIIIISTLVVLVTASMALAGFHGKRGPDGPGRFDGPGIRQGNVLVLVDELELTDEQIQKIKDLTYAHHSAMIDMKAQLEKAELEMRHEMQSDNPSKEKALALTRQISDIRAKMAEARTMHRFDVHGLLTSEQLQKLRTLQGPGRRGLGMNGPGRGRSGMGGPGQGQMGGQGAWGSYGMRLRDGSCGR